MGLLRSPSPASAAPTRWTAPKKLDKKSNPWGQSKVLRNTLWEPSLPAMGRKAAPGSQGLCARARNSCDCISSKRLRVRWNSKLRRPPVYRSFSSTSAEMISLTLRS